MTDLPTDELAKHCLARQLIEQKTYAEEDNDESYPIISNNAESENRSIKS